MDFSAILSHPLKDEIVEKLLSGSDPKSVSEWLKVKYQDKKQSHLRLSIKLLNDFIKSQYMDYYKQFQSDLTSTKSGDGTINKAVASSLLNNKTYQERLNELADKEINIKQMLRGTIMMVQDRAIQVFDKIQENPGMVGKSEYALIKWVEQLLNACEKYDKFINNSPDQVIQHNYTIKYIDQQTAFLQDAIRSVISEVDSDNSLKLVEKFTAAISRLKQPTEKEMSVDMRLSEVQLLQENVIKEVSEDA